VNCLDQLRIVFVAARLTRRDTGHSCSISSGAGLSSSVAAAAAVCWPPTKITGMRLRRTPTPRIGSKKTFWEIAQGSQKSESEPKKLGASRVRAAMYLPQAINGVVNNVHWQSSRRQGQRPSISNTNIQLGGAYQNKPGEKAEAGKSKLHYVGCNQDFEAEQQRPTNPNFVLIVMPRLRMSSM
jgi:hypothetical protein